MVMERLRLEIAVKKIRLKKAINLTQVGKSRSVAIIIQFLDFPDIIIHPLGTTRLLQEQEKTLQEISFNVSHKADFMLQETVRQSVFPTQCFCTLVELLEKDKARVLGKWASGCAWIPTDTTATGRVYMTVEIHNRHGEAVGTVEISSRVLGAASHEKTAQSIKVAPPQRRTSDMPSSSILLSNFLTKAGPTAASHTDATSLTSSPGHRTKKAPQKIRVVIKESGSGALLAHHGAVPVAPLVDPSVPAGNGLTDPTELAVAPPGPLPPNNPVFSAAPPPSDREHNSSFVGEKRSLLAVLRYDVVYQLQSTSETLAASLKREERFLSKCSCNESGARLLRLIEKHVQKMLKILNVLLQFANRLASSPTRGTFREVTDDVQQRYHRNPINRLKTPPKGSVGYFLMFDVLYQLQCVETHLSYLLESYEKELNIPIHTVDPTVGAYCSASEEEVHHLMKYVNILVQSAIDGRLEGGHVSRKEIKRSPSSSSSSSLRVHRKHRSSPPVETQSPIRNLATQPEVHSKLPSPSRKPSHREQRRRSSSSRHASRSKRKDRHQRSRRSSTISSTSDSRFSSSSFSSFSSISSSPRGRQSDKKKTAGKGSPKSTLAVSVPVSSKVPDAPRAILPLPAAPGPIAMSPPDISLSFSPAPKIDRMPSPNATFSAPPVPLSTPPSSIPAQPANIPSSGPTPVPNLKVQLESFRFGSQSAPPLNEDSLYSSDFSSKSQSATKDTPRRDAGVLSPPPASPAVPLQGVPGVLQAAILPPPSVAGLAVGAPPPIGADAQPPFSSPIPVSSSLVLPSASVIPPPPYNVVAPAPPAMVTPSVISQPPIQVAPPYTGAAASIPGPVVLASGGDEGNI